MLGARTRLLARFRRQAWPRRCHGCTGRRRGAASGGGDAGAGARPQLEARRRRLLGQEMAVVPDLEPAIEQLAQFDVAAGKRATVSAGGNGEPADAHADGVVPADDARVATAEAVSEIARGAAPDAARPGGGARGAPIESDEKGRRERVGGPLRGDPTQGRAAGPEGPPRS